MTRRSAEKPPATLELVLKRNSGRADQAGEGPLGIRDELPALIAAGYEQVPEEDIVRLKWWGLYHDKPKIGTFMLRIKLPAGRVTAGAAARDRRVSLEYGRGDGELSTRQTSSSTASSSPRCRTCSRRLDAAGLTTAGGCGDAVRNITGCPVAGLAHDELFDVTPVRRRGGGVLLRQPRLLGPAAQAQEHDRRLRRPLQRARDQLHLARRRAPRRREGFAVLVGGGLSSVPRIARDLGVFVRATRRSRSCCALLDAWKEDLRYRVSRVKARLKFMVDDIGPEGMRAEVERRLGTPSPDFDAAPSRHALTDHIGVHAAEAGRPRLVGVPVHLGLISGDQMIAVADLAEARRRRPRHAPAELRARRAIPAGDVDAVGERLGELGFPLDVNPLRADSIACTGEPHCNFSVDRDEDAARRADRGTSRRASATTIAGLRLHLDGCPHACAQHWVGDLGFQGTTARDEDGVRRQAYDIFCAAASAPTRRSRGRCSAACRPRSSTTRSTGLIAAGSRQREDGRDLPRVLRPHERRRARRRWPGREPREEPTTRRRRHEHVELLDELEAGELSVEFEGEEPRGVLEWAIERFGRRLAISTAFQVDDVALIDMAYGIDPTVSVFSSTPAGCPTETFELIEPLRDRYPGLDARAALARRAAACSGWSTGTGRTSSTARSSSACSAATCARCSR